MQEIQERIQASPAKICGGVARAKAMNQLENISDLDITTGDKTVEYLSAELAKELKKEFKVNYQNFSDHSTIFLGNLKIDFSSNFNLPNIDQLLKDKNIIKPTSMQKEMFSRDFTCNALLLTLDLKNIIDPTNQGLNDINKKIIKTCLFPEITLTANRNRVVRSIYLAAKLDFEIDQSIIDFVSKNPSSINISSQKSLTEKLTQAFNYNPDKTSFYLTKMNIWNYIPVSEKIFPYYQKMLKNKVINNE